MKKIATLLIMTAVIAGVSSCKNKPQSTSEGFEWQIDRFDDIKVLRYQVPDFETLTANQKLLVYYLSEAAQCGRDILFDQNFKYNLPIRRTLEAIYQNYSGDKNDPQYAEFEKYLKKVWFANGIHHHYSNDKFTPTFSSEYFDVLIAGTPELALPNDMGTKDELLAAIKPAIFDSSLYAKRVNQDSNADMITTSANNYYEGLTQAEVEEFYAKMADSTETQPISYGLNSKLIKEDSIITERVWKVGGMYSAAIEKIVYWLEKAVEVAENDLQKQTLSALVSYYRSGELKDFDKFNVLWVGDVDSQIDYVNGFTEVYGDPMGYKGAWESIVNFKNVEATKRTEAISGSAQWFEDNSPIDGKYKKPLVKGVSAKVITVAMLGGDAYPATAIGINLPNADWIRVAHGSKSVTIENITYAYAQAAQGDGFNDEFMLRTEDKERISKYGALADNLHTDLHECLGHGSGQLAPGTKGDELRNYGSPLEEARADLFALYYLGDKKMIDLGLIPSLDAAKAEYAKYIMNGMMTQFVRIQPGKTVEQAHMRNRKLIAEWCYEKGKAENIIEKVVKEGKTYIVVNDFDKLRGLFADLLKEIQRIKSEGDFAAGKALVENYGVNIDPELHKEVLKRYAALNMAPYSGFVNPQFELVKKGDKIVDVKLSYDESYVDQMLRYAKDYSFLPNKN